MHIFTFKCLRTHKLRYKEITLTQEKRKKRVSDSTSTPFNEIYLVRGILISKKFNSAALA